MGGQDELEQRMDKQKEGGLEGLQDFEVSGQMVPKVVCDMMDEGKALSRIYKYIYFFFKQISFLMMATVRMG